MRARAALVALALLGANAGAARAAGDPPVAHAFALANGARVYVAPMTAGGDVVIAGTIALSPAFDPPGKTGTGVVTADILAARSSRAGGTRFALGPDFSARGPATALPRMLARLAAALGDTTIAAAAFRSAVGSERRALLTRRTDAAARVETAFKRAVYRADDPVLRSATATSLAGGRRSLRRPRPCCPRRRARSTA